MEERLNEGGDCDDGVEEEEPNLCGICFAEEGKAMRGEIDSCDHYFCFVCIMEWSKVESRCPACKRRFERIVRPSNGGGFSSERVVRVPARDQANRHHFDPYVDTRCGLCGGMQDECYLLLCDLCDSAAHTYCAGLGYTVPPGDWFCNDCSILRQEHSSLDEECNREEENPTFWSVKEQVSIFDIVREESSNRAAESPAAVSAEVRKPLVVADKASDFDARTVRRCHDVRNHIQLFRENWEALRQGSLYFSPRSEESFEENSAKRRRISTGENDGTNQPSASSGGLTGEGSGSGTSTSTPPRGNHEVDRAWKMMEKARSKQSPKGSTSKTQQTGKSSVRRATGCDHLQSKKPSTSTRDIIQRIRSMTEERRSKIPRSESSTMHGSNFSARLADTSKRCDQHRPSIPAKEGRYDSAAYHVNGYSRPTTGKCPSSSSVSFTDAPGTSTPSTHPFRGEVRALEASTANHRSGKDAEGSAKSEIQSLVKLNLKLLSHRKLETDSFKRIARAATHAILAACGFEDSNPATAPAIRAPVCPHSPRRKDSSSSSLMPGSCKYCFRAFARDVVQSTMKEKLCDRGMELVP